jgi:hypothetical protein
LHVLIFKLPERGQKIKILTKKKKQNVNCNTKRCSSFKHLKYNEQAAETIKVPQTTFTVISKICVTSLSKSSICLYHIWGTKIRLGLGKEKTFFLCSAYEQQLMNAPNNWLTLGCSQDIL